MSPWLVSSAVVCAGLGAWAAYRARDRSLWGDDRQKWAMRAVLSYVAAALLLVWAVLG